jgi:hypothetical protein
VAPHSEQKAILNPAESIVNPRKWFHLDGDNIFAIDCRGSICGNGSLGFARGLLNVS